MLHSKKIKLYTVTVLFLNALLWVSVRNEQASWANVPSAPSLNSSLVSSLGDKSFLYRANGIMLQNLGEWDGQGRFLDNYNYKHIEAWLFLQHELDPYSNHSPSLAAMYFGAAKQPENIEHLVDYLHLAGNNPEGKKWRWLAQAVHMLRHKVQNNEKAYKFALDLSNLNQENPNMPAWTRQLPALIKSSEGNKEEALKIMKSILQYEIHNLHPAEVFATTEYICTRLLEEAEAKQEEICHAYFQHSP